MPNPAPEHRGKPTFHLKKRNSRQKNTFPATPLKVGRGEKKFAEPVELSPTWKFPLLVTAVALTGCQPEVFDRFEFETR